MPLISTVRGAFGPQGKFDRRRIGAGSTGGTITTSGGFRIHTFVTGATSGGTFTFLPDGWGNVEVLVVAGGGAGAGTGPGGGAGGMIYNASVPISSTTYSVVVGNGAIQSDTNGNLDQAANGGNSSFANLVAIGGGSGRTHGNTSGVDGGSGSGGPIYPSPDYTSPGGLGVAGQGNNGGVAQPAGGSWVGLSGGGGGAGQVGYPGIAGSTPGANSNVLNGRGGDGLANSISGSSVYYAGGGNGSEVNLDWVSPQTPLGGGGVARANDTGTNGTNGLGGGGGGGAFGGGTGPVSGESGGPYWRGGRGGSGIVIIRYPI